MSIQLGQWNVDQVTLKRILDFLPYPFLISEVHENVTYNSFVNRKFLDEIGYSIEEIPTIDDWFLHAYPDKNYRTSVVREWNKTMQEASRANEDSFFMKALVQTKNSGKKWYEVKSSHSGDNQLVAFVNINEEISREEELIRLNENKNRTLAILSHDLRGPLTNLHSLAQLAINSHLTQAEFIDTVKNVQEKTFQVLEFLDTTLHWTRSNFDNINLKIQAVDLHDLVTTVLKVYESSYGAKHQNITIHHALKRKILTDPEIATIVFRNLISNAIKFTPDGGAITVTLNEGDDAHILSVMDTGIGMSSELINRLFSDQYHSQHGTRQEKGLGIGLRLCHELLKKIDAQLNLDSKPGHGTTVKILFPHNAKNK